MAGDTAMKWQIAFVLMVLASPALAQGAQKQPPPAAGAVGAATTLTPSPDVRAKQWLTLVDDKNYSDAYKQMGTAAQAKVAANNWAQKIGTARDPLGAMASRDIKSINLAGQSATVQFESSFAHKTQALETVQLVSDKGAWSVVSYTVN
jgi:hypothetical protein